MSLGVAGRRCCTCGPGSGLAERTGLPVHVENSGAACALAHIWLGPGEGGNGVRDFVYVTVSDGVGTGVVVNGELVRGHGHTAGEFGHIPIGPDGPRCVCGAQGCLEAHTSNLATVARYLGYDFSPAVARELLQQRDRKSTRLNSSHGYISYAVFCLK